MDIALARKDNAAALQQAEAAIKRWPDRRALGMAYASALQGMNRHDEAQAYLRERARQWGEDEPGLYQILAKSEESTNRPVAARRDVARFYELAGAYAAAESQLQQGARHVARFLRAVA